MRKPGNKILSMMLALSFAMAIFMALALLPITAAAATGTIECGGSNSLNIAQSQSDTGWSWNVSTSTLTLDNSYPSSQRIDIICAPTDNINLVYNGDVSINYSNTGSPIFCKGNLTITGNGGTLTISRGTYGEGLISQGKLTITGNAKIVSNNTNGDGSHAVYGEKGVDILGDASVTADTDIKGSGIGSNSGNITINTTGTVIAGGAGTGYALSAPSGNINISNGTVTATADTSSNVCNGTLNHAGGTLNGTAPSDTTAPSLTARTVSRTSDTNATAKFTSDEAGSYYYEVVADGAGQPVISTTGTGTACGTTENTITLSTLTAGAKDIYIVVKDAAGNVSAATFKIDIVAYSAGGNIAPTISSVTPNGASEEHGGNIVITFDEPMGTTVGTVSLDNGIGALSGGSWTNNTTYSIPYSGLDWYTTYVIAISGFSDVAGNVMTSDSNNSFTTKADDVTPSVSPASLSIPVGETRRFTVSLGTSGAVTSATVTSDDPSIAEATPGTTTGGVITVEGKAVDSTSIKISFIGGSYADIDVPVTVTAAPTPVIHIITASAGAGGSISPSGSVSVTDGDNQDFIITPNSGYRINDVLVDGVSQGAIANYTFSAVTGNHSISASFESTGGTTYDNDSGSGSGSGSGGSGVGNTVSAEPTLQWFTQAEIDAAIKSAQDNGLSSARTRSNGLAGIRGAQWNRFGTLAYSHDTIANGAVQTRIAFPNPAKLTADMLLSGAVKGSAVNNIKAFFEKWYSNKLRVVHFEQKGAWGQRVEVAAKVDFTGMDTTTKLYFYHYDKASNTYKLLVPQPKYWIDSNDYIHFETDFAGDIIISEGILAKK